ncbi:hypothetical protein MFLAVUS_001541 [Mucor flavus]|uniref:Uncharacterized protein n=1 Tax=Mucor flavus TaxID=439312 RepID=A0ABP9YMT7_9FUNG
MFKRQDKEKLEVYYLLLYSNWSFSSSQQTRLEILSANNDVTILDFAPTGVSGVACVSDIAGIFYIAGISYVAGIAYVAGAAGVADVISQGDYLSQNTAINNFIGF